MGIEFARKPVVAAVSLCAVVLGGSIVFIDSKGLPIDRRVCNVAFSSSGRWLAAGTAHGQIAVWDELSSGAVKRIAFPHGSLNDLQFSPDERALAIASDDLGVYVPGEPAEPRLLRSDHAKYGSARFSPDGKTLLVVTGSGSIEEIDGQTGGSGLRVCCSSIYGEAVFTPDGREIVNAGHWPRLWEAGSGRLIAPLTADREISTFRPIAFDVARNAVLMGSQDGRVYVWDRETRQRIAVSPAQSAYVDTLAVSADGWVIFAGFGHTIQLWNPRTGENRSLAGARPSSNLVVGPDGNTVVFGTANGRIERWDIRTNQRIRSVSSSSRPTGSPPHGRDHEL